ncbi:unnamed protein product [Cuscuta campestris]|uniref:RING-type domain-containing protein n=1 Tax=Cuscuta campestris TaxID=132261 RepID=A0A484LG43_9ASTE|nr:unnamed protein product [Cuscuta campestris]
MNFPIPFPDEDSHQAKQGTPFEFGLLVFIYATVLGVMLMVIALMVKLMGFCDGAAAAEEEESSRLLSKEAAWMTYGVFDDEEEEDEESGAAAAPPSRGSSSEDLFDGKLCAICYDKRRRWLFFPCGHCATCSSCTKRIMEGKAKTCPFCRGFIHNVSRFLNRR